MKAVLMCALVLLIGCAVGNRAGAVTLEDALLAAYHNSPLLLARRAELRATDERMTQAFSGWRPTVTGDAFYQRRYQSSGIGGANSRLNPNVQFDPQRIGITLTQPVFRGGQTLAEMGQAKAEVHEGRANLRATEQDVLLNTAISFFDVRQDQNVRDLNYNNVEVLRQQLAATEDRFAVGEITRTDVAQAKAALSSAIAGYTLAEAQLTGSRARYQRYVGMLPANLEAPDNLPPLPANEADALAIAVERNPFLVAARYREKAGRYIVRRAVGNMLPTVSIEGEFSRIKNPSQFRAFTRVRQILARLTVPFYQGGGATSRVREARQLHNQRRIETLVTDRDMRKRLRDAWAQLTSVQGTIVSRREQVRANEIALEGVRQEALVGTRTVLNVLEEEQRHLDSLVNLEKAIHDEYAAAYQILSVIGDLTPERLELSTKTYDPAVNYRAVRYKFFGLGRSAGADPLPGADAAPVAVPTTQVAVPAAQVGGSGTSEPVENPTPKPESPPPTASAPTASAPTAAAPPETLTQTTTPPAETPPVLIESQGAGEEDLPKARKSDAYRVQIAAYRTVARAERGWKILSARHRDVLAKYSPDIVTVDLSAKGDYYRLRVGPVESKEEARQICVSLKEKGQNCLVVRP